MTIFHGERSEQNLPLSLMIALLRSQFWHLFHLVDGLLFHWRLNNYFWWIKDVASEYLHSLSLSSLSFFMYLLPISLYLSIALTSSSLICFSFKTPPSWFKMNIKKKQQIFARNSSTILLEIWTCATKCISYFYNKDGSPRLCREYLKSPLRRYIHNNRIFRILFKDL